MPQVEIYDRPEASEPSFVADFGFLPRVGEYISKEVGGYFRYLNVTEVWHREDSKTGVFRACVRVEAED
jgi:hypothetical protein